jgi:hypothetical protein
MTPQDPHCGPPSRGRSSAGPFGQGEIGVVQSVWRSSPGFCEVEFRKQGESFAVRALIRAEHLEVLEAAARHAPERNAQAKP